MTKKQFVRALRDVAFQQVRAVLAIDFEPTPKGVVLTFRFKEHA